jgi:Cu2+-containing amine oxidase
MAYGNFHNVSGAGWSVYWRIQQQKGSGLEIWWADFQGRRVMWRGSAPFAIVPYHHPDTGNEPPGPHFCYKDGIDKRWGGADFRALVHGAPNSGAPWTSLAWDAANDTDAVVVTTTPANDFEPATLTITAKFQCGWYQYVHSWQFDSYGAIHPRAAMGGMLNPFPMGAPQYKSHIHNFYFRIDLDIDGQYPHDVCEIFNHNSLNDPGGDKWDVVPKQMKLLANPDTARKWRVRSTTSKLGGSGEFRSYEIEVPQLAGRDQFSTGDVWVTVYRGDGVQQGEGVAAADASDHELETKYALGPLHPATTGDDIVLWVAIRAHHEPRFKGEESNYLPYHYEEFSIVPRSFTVFGPQTSTHG